MRHLQHWYFPQFRCNMRKISAKRHRRAKLLYMCACVTPNKYFLFCPPTFASKLIEMLNMLNSPQNYVRGIEKVWNLIYKFFIGILKQIVTDFTEFTCKRIDIKTTFGKAYFDPRRVAAKHITLNEFKFVSIELFNM